MNEIKISTEYIKLDQFLKFASVCDSGATAKIIIGDEQVRVNDELELRRGKKLRPGDVVEVFNKRYVVRGS